MRPVLTVEGEQYEVDQIDWRHGKPIKVGVFKNNEYIFYHDAKENENIDIAIKVNLDECLKWQGRYDEIYQTIDKVIEDNQKEIQGLATEIADSVLPFSFPEQVAEREKLKERTFGLMDAQDIIHEFMVEDVDLSGGEE